MVNEHKVEVGKIIHFFPKINVAVVHATKDIRVGDRLLIEGRGQSFEQVVSSMQVEHKNIADAKPGQEFGMKTDKPVRDGDLVYKV
jgi:hypothetical protein